MFIKTKAFIEIKIFILNNFFGTDTMIRSVPLPLSVIQQKRRPGTLPYRPLASRVSIPFLPHNLSCLGRVLRGCPFIYLVLLDKNISRALATDGASTVGAEMAISSPASSIAFTMDLPYDTNLMSPWVKSGWFS